MQRHDHFANGVEIPDAARRTLSDLAGPPAPGTALADLDPAEADWLAADASADFGRGTTADPTPCVPRLAMLIHRSRADLRRAFPDPLGSSRAGYSYWYVTDGRLEYGLSSRLLGPVLASLRPRQRLSARMRWWWGRLRRWRRHTSRAHPGPGMPAATALASLHDTWETLAQSDPLWAILTCEDKRQGRWDPQEFFETGRQEISATLRRLDELGIELDRTAALDFGCGAGRLTQALARHFQRAVGVDISETMIRLARQYSQQENTTFILNQRNDLSTLPDNSFSFLYTGRVLQHIRPELTERYVRDFFRVLAPGGVAAFQIPNVELTGVAAVPAVAPAPPDLPVEVTAASAPDAPDRPRDPNPSTLPAIEMYVVPQAEVMRWIEESGGEVLNVAEDEIAGPAWISHTYYVVKPRDGRPPAGS